MIAFLVVLITLLSCTEAFNPQSGASRALLRPNQMSMFFGKKPAPPPPPPPPVEKKGMFSAFSFSKKEPEPVVEEPEPAKDMFYTARRVTRFMMFPWIFNKYEDTEENPGIRKTVKIVSPPSAREKAYARLARGEVDDVDEYRDVSGLI